jgi:hypothetical protein
MGCVITFNARPARKSNRLARKILRNGEGMKKKMERHEVEQPADPSVRLIPLTFYQNAIVDVADYEWLNQFNWHAQWQPRTHSFYALRWKDGTTVAMGREILGLPDHTSESDRREADHQNGNTLDCRRDNLRAATPAQNVRNRKRHRTNRSGFKGVRQSGQKWSAKVCARGRTIYIGGFETAEHAARVYDSVARVLHGEFARCNFPENCEVSKKND